MKHPFEKTPWRPFFAEHSTIAGGWHVVDCDGQRLLNYVGNEEMARAICALPYLVLVAKKVKVNNRATTVLLAKKVLEKYGLGD